MRYETVLNFCNIASSLKTVEKWSKLFRDGREEIEDEARSGRPITETTFENIERIRLLIDDDSYLTIEELEYETVLGCGTTRRIIVEHLNLRKITTCYVPKDLTNLQRIERARICKENLAKFQLSYGTRATEIHHGNRKLHIHKDAAIYLQSEGLTVKSHPANVSDLSPIQFELLDFIKENLTDYNDS
ncbi:unnamed protein product [Adineta ricciae]|uniref:Uncharacterized protein n=1 Tax=Adineta ricciae TaxID=249248 RepID=A0A815U6U3_ADIRI|nr:unnamed protein product [Adineta ricciae]